MKPLALEGRAGTLQIHTPALDLSVWKLLEALCTRSQAQLKVPGILAQGRLIEIKTKRKPAAWSRLLYLERKGNVWENLKGQFGRGSNREERHPMRLVR